jgi:thiol-disulfide isomerase/thioredoxin
LKKYRRKRPYNIFKPDTNLYTASIREFNAFSIQKSDSIVLNFEKGKFFLDFWYIGCLPCFQSFPYIDSLEKVFAKNKIKFMKLNPININDTVMVKKYCKRHFLEKDNYLIQRNLCSNFSVDAYPSFIFIEDGQIIKKFTGFDESVYDELKLFFEKWTADSK